jgi:nitroreductase
MDTLDAIMTRRSIRKYAPEPVPKNLVNKSLAGEGYRSREIRL